MLTESRKLFGGFDPAAPGVPVDPALLGEVPRRVDPAAPSTRLGRTVPPSRGLSLAGPLRRAVGEFLPFPYGQAELDPLDDGLEDAQRLFPVGG